jgi:hypothetical protein
MEDRMDEAADEIAGQRPAGWYPAPGGESRVVSYWDGNAWSGAGVPSNRRGVRPRGRLGWAGLWLVIAGGSGIAVLILATLDEASRPGGQGTGLPFVGLAVFAAALIAGTVCGILASLRADRRHYENPQARAAFKAGGGMIVIAAGFALIALGIMTLGLIAAVTFVVLGLLMLGLIFMLA